MNRNHLYHAEDIGRLRCAYCGNAVTVGPSGTEYGHRRYADASNNAERCPKRPDAADPDSERGPVEASDDRHDNGQFKAW